MDDIKSAIKYFMEFTWAQRMVLIFIFIFCLPVVVMLAVVFVGFLVPVLLIRYTFKNDDMNSIFLTFVFGLLGMATWILLLTCIVGYLGS